MRDIHDLTSEGTPTNKKRLQEGDIFVAQIDRNNGFAYLFKKMGDRAVAIKSEDAIENERNRQRFGDGKTFSIPMEWVICAYGNHAKNTVHVVTDFFRTNDNGELSIVEE